MRQSYRIIPVYTADVSGVCSALYELGGMVVMHDPSGCNSTYNTHDEIRWYDQDSLIYISGLNSIDRMYLEAAAIDGANAFQRFRHVTLPLLMPSITINLFLTLAGAFRLFDMNVTLTNGGPGRSTVGLALDVYKDLFSNNKMGYGSAKAVVLLVVVMLITVGQVWFTKRKEVEM